MWTQKNVFQVYGDITANLPHWASIPLALLLTSMTMRPTGALSAVMSKNTRGRTIFADLCENWRIQLRNRFDIRSAKESELAQRIKRRGGPIRLCAGVHIADSWPGPSYYVN